MGTRARAEGLESRPCPRLPLLARALTWGWRSSVGSASGSTAVGGRGWGPDGGAPGVRSCEWASGRPGGSGSTWQSLRMMGWGGFGKRESRQVALGMSVEVSPCHLASVPLRLPQPLLPPTPLHTCWG